jgi:hypothetical protein
MSRSACTFKKGDVRRAVEAVRAAGEAVSRVEVGPDGKVIVVIGKPDDSGSSKVNEWDSVLDHGNHKA